MDGAGRCAAMSIVVSRDLHRRLGAEHRSSRSAGLPRHLCGRPTDRPDAGESLSRRLAQPASAAGRHGFEFTPPAGVRLSSGRDRSAPFARRRRTRVCGRHAAERGCSGVSPDQSPSARLSPHGTRHRAQRHQERHEERHGERRRSRSAPFAIVVTAPTSPPPPPQRRCRHSRCSGTDARSRRRGFRPSIGCGLRAR